MGESLNPELPEAVWSGTFRLFGVDVKCHTLSTGQRIIEAESFHALMDAMLGGGVADPNDITAFANWRTGQ